MTEWLSVPEFARLLNVRDSQVRELLRERHIVGARRGENNALSIPDDFVAIDPDGEPTILGTLRGTITVLADAGLDDSEIAHWLVAPNAELGQSPVDALKAGVRAPVRRAAQMVF